MSISKIVREDIKKLKPYIPGKHMDELKRELGITQIIKLASNENPLGPSRRAVEAGTEALKNGNLYPDSYCFYLKRTLAEKLGVDSSNILVGNGSDEIIKLLGETFLSKGDEVVTPSPSFSEYIFASNLMGAEVITVELEDFKINLSKMHEAITEKTKLVFICNPNNPTGTIVTKKELEKFLDILPDHVVVVMDEAYHEYVSDSEYPNGIDYINSGKKVIVLRTFSKIYGLAGLRIGYAVASSELIQWITRVKEPFNVNSVAQHAAIESLKDEDHVSKSKKLIHEEKQYLYKRLDEMGLFYIPTHTNFILIDVETDSNWVFNELLKKGIIIRTGDIFNLPTFIRVTIGTRIQNKKFLDELAQILKRVSKKARAF